MGDISPMAAWFLGEVLVFCGYFVIALLFYMFVLFLMAFVAGLTGIFKGE